MPKYNELGHVIPDDETDAPSMETAIQNLSLSNPGIPNVNSRAEANAVRDAYLDVAGNEHPVNPPQMMVWRLDSRQLEVESESGGWEYLAGRQHGATLRFSRSGVPENPSGPLVLYATEFIRNSPGWTMSSASNLVIPQSGMYVMYCDINISGAAGSLGRTFFQYSTTNGAISARHTVTNENNLGGTAMWPLTKGNELRIQVYHEGGGARTYSAVMQIAMINSPNW